MTGEFSSATTLGRYHLEKRIARGGMGELWLARAKGAAGWEKHVVVKTILPHLSDQEEFVERFLDEANIATTLSHGNIVPVFELGQDGDTWFIVMEYVDGWDLRTILRRARANDQTISEELALYVVTQVCQGLDYAHNRKDEQGRDLHIVHRDISPANILISRDGDVRIVDFGIATAKRRINQTLTGELRGKFAYMSPEQALGQSVDRRSDIFSLGVVLYEMLAGTRPFDGDSDMEVLGKVQRAQYLPLQAHRPDLSAEVCALIERALSNAPQDRFADAHEMHLAAIHALRASSTIPVARDLAKFCLQFDRPTWSTGTTSGPSFDALLREQLAELHGDTGSTPSFVTPSESSEKRSAHKPVLLAASSAYSSKDTPDVTPTSLPTGNSAPSITRTPAAITRPSTEHTQTVRVDRRHIVRKKRIWWAIGVVSVLIVVTSIIAFRAGSRAAASSPVVRITTDPTGALISFNGVTYGRSTLVARLEPGEFVIRAELDGFEVQELPLVYDGKADLALDIPLRQLPAAASGKLTFPTEPAGASIRINDGPPIPLTDAVEIPLFVPVKLRFELEGYEPIERVETFDGLTQPQAVVFTPLRPEEEEPSAVEVSPMSSSSRPEGESETRVRITGLPSNARVFVDGVAQSSASSVRVPARSQVRIAAEAPGYERAEIVVNGRDVQRSLSMNLKAVESGTLTVRFIGSILTGEVLVNGRSYGFNERSPRTQLQLPEGSYRITVRNPDLGKIEEHEVRIRPGEERVLRIDW